MYQSELLPFTVIQGHLFWYHSKARVLYILPLVVNSNLDAILHHFRDTAA